MNYTEARSPTGFIGRSAELQRLTALLDRVRKRGRDQPGVAVLLRGRRRVGKSRLVEVFCERAGKPWVYLQASHGAEPAAERGNFATSVLDSNLPNRDMFAGGVTLSSWTAFLRQLATTLPDDQESIVVIDELPWLIEADPALEGALQTAWDSLLARKPVLLILIGSDLAMMESLDDYRRPFHQRGTVMVLPPLNPAEVGSMLELSPAESVDAYLITGGLPMICQEWHPGDTPKHFLEKSLADPTSALMVSGERSLAAEFPAQLRAQSVLASIGNGERTWGGNLSGESEQIPTSSLTNSLQLLQSKHIIAVDNPLSTAVSKKERRYRVADPYLRFYLAFLRDGLPLVERGRPDLLLRKVERSWTSWRGRAVEPVIREAILRRAPELGWPETEAVGGWWNRQNNPEIDLVGADRDSRATKIQFVGSIKWHESRLFDRHDHAALLRDMTMVPGVDSGTEPLAVSRSGADADVPMRVLAPRDLLVAWHS